MAGPTVMGMFGFAVAVVMVGSWQAGWYGGPKTALVLWPFALAAGGIVQVVAAVVSFHARDGVAVATHTASGAFWLAWGIQHLLVATKVLAPTTPGTVNASFGMWFVALGAVIVFACAGAVTSSLGMVATLATYTGGLGLSAAGWFAGSLDTLRAGGWLFVVAGALASYTAAALMLSQSYGRTVLPIGKPGKRDANVPGRSFTAPICYERGMPGVRLGQ